MLCCSCRCDARFQDESSLEEDEGFADALFAFLQYLHAHRTLIKPEIECLQEPKLKSTVRAPWRP